MSLKESLTKNGTLKSETTAVAENLIKLGYVLGISLLLSALIYFFAANWRGLDRYEKIAASAGLIVLFYALSFIFSRALKYRELISNLLLFAGCVSFGIGLALLGQLYNAHADSYLLFLVWLVPALLFSLITRYQPFYVLSYILFHLAVWFFLWPSSHFLAWGIHRLFAAFAVVALMNAVLFVIIELRIIISPPLRYMSFLLFHIALISMTVSFVFRQYAGGATVFYAVLSVFLFYLLLKRNGLKGLAGILSFAVTVFLIVEFAELLYRYNNNILVYFAALLFAVFLVVGNVFLMRYLNRAEMEAVKSARNRHKAFTAFITFAASALIVGAILGIISLLTHRSPVYPLFFIAVFFFVLPPLLTGKGDPTVRHTLLSTGLLMVLIASTGIHVLLPVGFVVILVAFWKKFESGAVFSLGYLSLHILLYTIASRLLYSLQLYRNYDTFIPLIFVLFVLLNTGIYLFARAARPGLEADKTPAGTGVIIKNSTFFGLFSFFILTFFFARMIGIYYTVNILYFISVTAFLLWAVKNERTAEYKLALLFWFAFLGYKYYELIWQLLHKSIALLILGLLFTAAAFSYDRARGARGASTPAYFSSSLLLILPLIVLQLFVVGYQVAKSEYLLADSKLIKLELRPVDPRSIMQGDYIVLGYAISSATIPRALKPMEKVQIVLAPGADGVYQFTGVYKYKGQFNREYAPTGDAVLITGRSDGAGGLIFGIESYFVPEGTGRALEQTINYAYVKVAANGASILVEVADE